MRTSKCPRCGEPVIMDGTSRGSRDWAGKLYCTEDCCDSAIWEREQQALKDDEA